MTVLQVKLPRHIVLIPPLVLVVVGSIIIGTANPPRQKKLDVTTSIVGSYEHCLGTTRYKLGQYAEARSLLSEAVKKRMNALGRKNADTANSMLQLAETLYELNEIKQADHLYSETLAIRTEILGIQHPDTIYAMEALANCCQKMSRLDDAESLLSKALALRKRREDSNLDQAITMANLGNTKALKKAYPEAEQLQIHALQIVTSELGENNFLTAKLFHNLAACYQDQEKFTEAEKLLLKAIRIKQNLRQHLSLTYGTKHLAWLAEEIDVSKIRLASLYFERTNNSRPNQ